MPAASVEAGQVVLSNGVEPLRETLALAVSEHGREGSDVTGLSGENHFGAPGERGRLAR